MHKTWKISVDALLRFSFVFYLCFDLANAFFRKLLGIIGIGSLSSFICYLCIYIPVLICCLCIRKRRVVDSLALYFFLLLFFGITILIHPEYEYFYEREYWGVWDYVFRPENGIHIFLYQID